MPKQIYRLNLFWPFFGTPNPELGARSIMWISSQIFKARLSWPALVMALARATACRSACLPPLPCDMDHTSATKKILTRAAVDVSTVVVWPWP